MGWEVDWLFEVASEIKPEEGAIWVFSLDDKDGVTAFAPSASNACVALSAWTSGPKYRGADL